MQSSFAFFILFRLTILILIIQQIEGLFPPYFFKSDIADLGAQTFKDIFYNELKNDTHISDECKNELARAFSAENEENRTDIIHNLTRSLVARGITYTPKSRNDFSGYEECIEFKYKYHLLTPEENKFDQSIYIVFYINNFTAPNNRTRNIYLSKTFFMSVCIPKMSCNKTEYIYLCQTFLSLSRAGRNITLVMTYEGVLEEIKKIKFIKIICFELVPLYICIVLYIMFSLEFLPFCLVKKFFIRKNKKEEDKIKKELQVSGESELNQSSMNAYDYRAFLLFRRSLSFSRNCGELFFYQVVFSSINNESGLKYTRGIKGISMIFLTFGLTFYLGLNSPIVNYWKESLRELFTHFFFFFFYTGLRYSPKILFSISGCSLFYKLSFFIEENVEDIHLQKLILSERESREGSSKNDRSAINLSRESNDEKNNLLIDNNTNMDKSVDGLTSSDSTDFTNYRFSLEESGINIPYWLLLKFYLFQLHKYIYYVISVFFLILCKYHITNVFAAYQLVPTWMLFGKYLVSKKIVDVIKPLFFLNMFFGRKVKLPPVPIEDEDEYYERNADYVLYNKYKINAPDFFWVAENEIMFFMLTSFLIFISYKMRINFHFFFLGFIVLFITLRSIFYNTENATGFYDYSNWDYRMNLQHPLNNYSYFLIGTFFGSLNFVVQKGLTQQQVRNKWKTTFKTFSFYTAAAIKNSKYVVNIIIGIGFILMFLLSFFPVFIIKYKISENDFLNEFRKNNFCQAVLYIDGIIVVLLVQFISFSFFIRGNRIFSGLQSFLSNPFWSIFNKIYFSFLLVLPSVLFTVFFKNEILIETNFRHFMFLSLICFSLTFAVGCLAYVIVELPLKRITKMIFQSYERESDEKFQEYILSVSGEKHYKFDEDIDEKSMKEKKDDSSIPSDNPNSSDNDSHNMSDHTKPHEESELEEDEYYKEEDKPNLIG